MQNRIATCVAPSNIALIKYWGNRDDALRLASNPSLSFNLGDLCTTTSVQFDPSLSADAVTIDGKAAVGEALARVTRHLDLLPIPGRRPFAQVTSANNFPMGAGIASSASGFAALTVAMCAAAGLHLAEDALSALARRGSGSACRSVPGGFVVWRDGFAQSIAPPGHWALSDVIGVVSSGHKKTGSTEGHALAGSSPLQAGRVADTPRRFDACQRAIRERDFDLLAAVIEQDALMMHGVMMTSQPALMYWLPASLAIMAAVVELRGQGVPVAFTIDAGPNIHCVCETGAAERVAHAVRAIPGVRDALVSGVGGPARVLSTE